MKKSVPKYDLQTISYKYSFLPTSKEIHKGITAMSANVTVWCFFRIYYFFDKYNCIKKLHFNVYDL